MTNEQAIEMLSEMRSGYNCFDESEKPFYEALSMAIEALSCSEKPNRSDVISRQDAIYYVKQATIGETDVMKAWVKAQTHLMRLPSAQPERKKGEWIEEPGKIPRCSNCGIYSDDADKGYDKYCPNCGARMRGEEE